MKTFLIVIFSFLIQGSFSLSAQTAYSEDNADAVYEHIYHEYTLNKDESVTYRYAHQLRLKTSFAFTRQYGESFIIYNPQFQKLNVFKAETKMADGSIIVSPPNAFNEVLPQFAADAAPYMHLREMVVTHTGIEKDAVVHFAYTVDTKKGYFPGLMGKVLLADRSPIKKLSVIINVPSGKTLKFASTAGEFKPEIRKDGKMTVYTWLIENVPMIAVEQGQPALEQIAPVLFFSTSDSKTNYKHIIPDEKQYYLIPESLKDKIQELIKDKTELKYKVITIADFIRKSAGMMTVDLNILGYRAMTAEKTLSNNAGSQLDKAILLTAVYRSLGIEAEPVLVSAYDKTMNDFSLLPMYNSVLVRVKGFDGWIDPVNQQYNTIPLAMNGYQGVVLKNNPEAAFIGNETIPTRFNFNGKLTISDQLKIDGKGTVDNEGLLSFNMNESGFKPFIDNLLAASSVKHAKGKSNEWTGNLTGVITTDASGLFAVLDLPKGIFDSWTLPVQTTARATPLIIPYTIQESYTWTIELPEKLSFRQEPVLIKMTNDAAEAAIFVNAENGLLTVKRNFSIKKTLIESKDYQQIVEFLKAARDPRGYRIILAVKQ